MKTREQLLIDPLASNIRQGTRSQFKSNRAGPNLKAAYMKICGRCERELELYYFNPSPDNQNLKMNVCIKCENELAAQKAARPVKVHTLDKPLIY